MKERIIHLQFDGLAECMLYSNEVMSKKWKKEELPEPYQKISDKNFILEPLDIVEDYSNRKYIRCKVLLNVVQL